MCIVNYLLNFFIFILKTIHWNPKLLYYLIEIKACVEDVILEYPNQIRRANARGIIIQDHHSMLVNIRKHEETLDSITDLQLISYNITQTIYSNLFLI